MRSMSCYKRIQYTISMQIIIITILGDVLNVGRLCIADDRAGDFSVRGRQCAEADVKTACANHQAINRSLFLSLHIQKAHSKHPVDVDN